MKPWAKATLATGGVVGSFILIAWLIIASPLLFFKLLFAVVVLIGCFGIWINFFDGFGGFDDGD